MECDICGSGISVPKPKVCKNCDYICCDSCWTKGYCPECSELSYVYAVRAQSANGPEAITRTVALYVLEDEAEKHAKEATTCLADLVSGDLGDDPNSWVNPYDPKMIVEHGHTEYEVVSMPIWRSFDDF